MASDKSIIAMKIANKKRFRKNRENRLYETRDKIKLDVSCAFIDDYRELYNKCEICGKENVICSKRVNLCVDHDHSTNKFRGLLCSVCNRQLGWFEKNKENIEKYLNKFDA